MVRITLSVIHFFDLTAEEISNLNVKYVTCIDWFKLGVIMALRSIFTYPKEDLAEINFSAAVIRLCQAS